MEAFGVVVLMVVVGLAIAAGYSLSQRREANEAWREAARRRNLLFHPGDLFTQPELAGTLEGHHLSVTVVTHGRDSARKYTRYRVEYREPLPAGLRISKEPTGLLAGVRRAFAGADIHVGDPEFDDTLRVVGSDVPLIRAFLTLPRRLLLLRVHDRYPTIEIDDEQISWDVRDVELNPDLIVATVDRLIETATGLSPGPSEQPFESDTQGGGLDPGPAEPGDSAHHIHSPSRVGDHPTFDAAALLSDLRDPDRPIQPETPAAVVADDDVQPANTPLLDTAADGTAAPDEPAGEPEPSRDDGATVAAVCATLFDRSGTSLEVPQAFAERYRGRHVRWLGRLTSVTRYPFDRIFGSEPGCRAVFTVHRTGPSFGPRDVRVVLQLPDGQELALRSSVGAGFEFEGRLIGYDRFMQTLFVAGGRILASPASGTAVG